MQAQEHQRQVHAIAPSRGAAPTWNPVRRDTSSYRASTSWANRRRTTGRRSFRFGVSSRGDGQRVLEHRPAFHCSGWARSRFSSTMAASIMACEAWSRFVSSTQRSAAQNGRPSPTTIASSTPGMLAEHRLDPRSPDVLPVGRLDEVLLPPVDREFAVFSQSSQVARP